MPDQSHDPTHNRGSRATLLRKNLDQHFAQETQLRERAQELSKEELATLIPQGPYCYTVVGPLPPPAIGRTITPCPFLIGSRPDTTCFLNPDPAYAIDLGYNMDACKRCGINDDDESIHETP